MLSARKNLIVDETGRPVRLRGFGIGGWTNSENFINGYPGFESGLRAALAEELGPARAEFLWDRMLDHFLAEDDEPDLDDGEYGLFPTVSVSQGDGQLEWKYLNILFRAWDDDEDYQVYYLRGDSIYQMPGGGDGDQAGPGVPVRRLNVRPSIVKSETRIDLELTRQGVVDLSVYDVQGRLVRCLGKGLLPQGWYHASWDGRDEARRRQSAGAYLVVLKTESGVMTRRIQLVGE